MEIGQEEFQVKRLGKEDILTAQELFQLFREVFETEDEAIATNSYVGRMLDNTGFVVYAALYENTVVGGLTAYALPLYYSEYTEIFIYDIAVKPDYQRKGIGKKLLSALKEYCREQGIGEMFVAAHEEDADAVAFYHATGGNAEKVIHFTYNTEN